jgi:phospholipid/cholesterol/gamma-HCH transport system substrate-binding protein
MEIRARYVQMGAFTLAVIAAAFVFVYWLNSAGGLRQRAVYRLAFDSPVSGLLRGSAVLFNGVRVGEVTELALRPENPRQVRATIAVDPNTPVRSDTTVGIDFQGLTGSPVVALTGGTSTAALERRDSEPPLLIGDPAASQSMSQSARDVLKRFDAILAENAQPLREMIANLTTFSGALARNSDRLDGIAAGLERMTGGAAARTRTPNYELTVPAVAAVEKTLSAQIVVADPTALGSLDTERIQSKSAAGVISVLTDAQWSDLLPKVIQLKIIRALENAKMFSGVSRPLEVLQSDYQLLVDIRRFELEVRDATTAEVELAAKILDDKGRILATMPFRASVPVEVATGTASATALDQAFGKAAGELIGWVGRTIGEQAR